VAVLTKVHSVPWPVINSQFKNSVPFRLAIAKVSILYPANSSQDYPVDFLSRKSLNPFDKMADDQMRDSHPQES